MAKGHGRAEAGFGLIELCALIVIIGVMVGVAMQSMTAVVTDVRRTKTEREMEQLSDAIVGNPRELQDGRRSDFGYVGDVGAFPGNLNALYTNPGGLPTWAGPYIVPDHSQDTVSYRLDEWGAAYTYTGGLTITSSGGGTAIVKKVADASSDYLLNSVEGLVKDKNDSLPGAIKKDSVDIFVDMPAAGSGIITKIYHPDASGNFILDSIPAGSRFLRAVYRPTNDTLRQYYTVLPRNQSNPQPTFKFSAACFSSGCGSSTVTLRPTGSGSISNLTSSGCASRWQCVSEAIADEDATRVICADNSYKPEVYAMADPTSSACAISKITVYCRARRTNNQGDVKPAIYIGGAEYDGGEQALTTSYVDYSAVWTTNPSTGSAWTWSNINSLECGVRLRGQNGTWPAYCTQVWVVVHY